MRKKTLLEKAKDLEMDSGYTPSNYSSFTSSLLNDEGLDIMLSYLNNEITSKQFWKTVGCPYPASTYISPVIRWALKNNKIEIIKK